VCFASIPGYEAAIKIETNTALKVKNLKEIIKQRGADFGLKDITADRLQLQIEGGNILKKNTAVLEDLGFKDRTHLVVTILEKGAPGT
jgi:hypothetical protein